MKVKQTYSPEEKARMVLEGLTYPDGIAKYCRSKGIRDTLFYKWKNQLEKNAKMVFAPQVKESAVEVRLRNELSKKDTIISELVAENLALKKKGWNIASRKHIMDREVMEDILQTGKRYQGYGVNLCEYCAGIGISASRWFRITKAWCKELSPKAPGKPTASPYALTEEEQQLVVAYALDNPRYYHREMAYRMIDENIVYTSPSTVYRILKKHGLIRENVQKKRYGWVHRYSNEAQYPDELWQADITYVRYKHTDVYQLSFIDVYSRFVVLSVPLTTMESSTVSRVFAKFIEAYNDTLKQKPRLQTDNGSCFIGSEFKSVMQQYVMEHTTIHPSTPTENVIIERWHRTFKELLYEVEEPESFEELVKSTQRACYYYNYERYHQSLGYMTPYEWYRGCPEKIYAEREMKMNKARRLRREANCIVRNYSLSLTAENYHLE